MKKISTILLVCICSLIIIISANTACICSKSNYSQYFSEMQNMLNNEWASYSESKLNGNGGVALHIISPKGDFFVSAGMGEEVTKNIHFRGASTTKTFTAASIFLLQQNGLLNIDDKITDFIPGRDSPYVPNSPDYAVPYKNDITIRQLLEHRAGVFDVSNNPIPSTVSAPYAGKRYIGYVREDLGEDDHDFTFDELVGVVASNGLYFTPPGTEFHYSNTGYSILGEIIERVSGKSYAQFVQDNFLTTNNFNETNFPFKGNDQTLPLPYAEGYLWYQNSSYQTTKDNMSPHVAEGNVITTPQELAEWVKRLIRGESGLDQEYAEMMMDVHPTGEMHQFYGLGCIYTPGLGYGHNGGHVGYMTVMRYDPDYDVTLVIFSNILNADDSEGQMNFMYGIGYSAREILGYPVS